MLIRVWYVVSLQTQKKKKKKKKKKEPLNASL